MSTISLDDQQVANPIHPAKKAKPLWNSLEIAKLIVGVLIPLAIAYATNQFTKIQEKRNRADEATLAESQRTTALDDERYRTAVARRLQIWAQMSPEMNDIYSYFLYVGDWKELKPEDIIKKKRTLDHLMYSNRIFFSEDYFNRYTAFTDAAFRTNTGWEQEPALKTLRVRNQDFSSKVQFSKCDNGDKVYSTLLDFQDQAAIELNLPKLKRSPRPPRPEEALAPSCE